MLVQKSIKVVTRGRGTHEITDTIQEIVGGAGIANGLCQVFVHHTSASLMLCENADPAVLTDLETIMARIAPDGDPEYRHTAEGPDDMAAHMRSVLTQTGLSIPVTGQRCDLGTWQGVYLWEHRYEGHQRRITVSVLGE
ncbi:MAG: secondary thiamine-phosphate synthase enzyme YjbQ [Gammaproteobacteria bacterium]|jgi:secondary thiamine-phosphate synthase enzyme|nr:secondary thiamine-phosphate synthase enzyme YjbQ [Gammaproteobacteria bacterium]MDP6616476.1 secondary thiamine-phosphate synthase enzyme YjbQ [Gammaproteobacteria bacterium]MDP6694276.1 secondary thiamine-phosphate synthase enzyme YjbQ [Gammaproteobacteria bacterium]MDP7041301.1 secondary thiamine-phosphate synthase enzyme YjbQ [Gammaproteobacteria bacterium]